MRIRPARGSRRKQRSLAPPPSRYLVSSCASARQTFADLASSDGGRSKSSWNKQRRPGGETFWSHWAPFLPAPASTGARAGESERGNRSSSLAAIVFCRATIVSACSQGIYPSLLHPLRPSLSSLSSSLYPSRSPSPELFSSCAESSRELKRS